MKTRNLLICTTAIASILTSSALAITYSRQTENGDNKKMEITEITIEWPRKHPQRIETPQGKDKQGNQLPPEVWYTEPQEKTFLNIGEDWEIEYEVQPKDADTSDLIWKTSNPKIAKVSKGIVTGLQCGRTEITVTTPNRKANAKVIVVVTGPPME